MTDVSQLPQPRAGRSGARPHGYQLPTVRELPRSCRDGVWLVERVTALATPLGDVHRRVGSA
jgi:hypothetical protein